MLVSIRLSLVGEILVYNSHNIYIYIYMYVYVYVYTLIYNKS